MTSPLRHGLRLWNLCETVNVGVQLRELGLATSDAPNEGVHSPRTSVASNRERSDALEDGPITEGLDILRLTRSRSRDHGLQNRRKLRLELPSVRRRNRARLIGFS